MKKEGTGDPKVPDIVLNANVKMRKLYFEEVSDPEVRFRGNTRRTSVWGSWRENLPDEVQEGVLYSNAGVRLRIASEMVASATDPSNCCTRETEQPDLEHRREKPRRQETETKEEEK